jgi:hypothetical protein
MLNKNTSCLLIFFVRLYWIRLASYSTLLLKEKRRLPSTIEILIREMRTLSSRVNPILMEFFKLYEEKFIFIDLNISSIYFH